MRNWIEEWKIDDSGPDLPGLFAIADSPKLGKIFYIGACPRSLRDEANLAECGVGNVLQIVEMFEESYTFLYWPCPNELGIVGQLPDLSAKLIAELRPRLNIKAGAKQLKPETNGSSVDAELLV